MNGVDPSGPTDPIVGILGCGVVGQAVGRVLRTRRTRVAWFDLAVGSAERARRRFGGVVLDTVDELDVVDVVVAACPTPQLDVVAALVERGRDVVCLSDSPDDVRALLALDERARRTGSRLVVGAALAPGLTGLIARHLADRLDQVDELHIAAHGTGGPACAGQHHDALGSTAVGWHDGEWIERPGGSGRELCWFPEPVGPADCYRAALADPLVLLHAFPHVDRVSARVSATRRDRMTARLPMLSPPHAEGDRGAVRVEVRGALDGRRVTHVAGAVGRTGDLAGAVAALFAVACIEQRCAPGVVVAGADGALSTWMLRGAIDAGVQLQEYTGVARVSA